MNLGFINTRKSIWSDKNLGGRISFILGVFSNHMKSRKSSKKQFFYVEKTHNLLRGDIIMCPLWNKFKDKEKYWAREKKALTIPIYENCLISCCFISVFSSLIVCCACISLVQFAFTATCFFCLSSISCLCCSFCSLVSFLVFVSIFVFAAVASSLQTISRVTFAFT